jgi:NAD(P)H-dependent FMN reductase
MERWVNLIMKKILIISVTDKSNLILAKRIKELFELQTEIITLEDYPLPLYTGKSKLKDQTVINDLCEKIIRANGFVFCGPEYNGRSAPILTNAITWISVTTDYWRDAFTDKIGLIATHSGGNGNSFFSTFKQQLEFLGMVVFPRSIIVNKNKDFSVESSKKIIERFQNLL